MGNMQLRADFGMIDQAASDIGTFKGKVSTEQGQAVLDAAMREVHNIDGGLGGAELAQVRSKVEGLISDWEQTQTTQQTATTNVGETMLTAGRMAKSAIATSQV